MMGVMAGQPIAGLPVVTMKGVDDAELGQPPKLAVDGSDPNPQTPRSQVRAEAAMKLGNAEKPVGTF
jgi:hypothetical protein